MLESFVDEFPERLIEDKAYDSDSLDEELSTAGIEMIAPHRGDRKKPAPTFGAVIAGVATALGRRL